MVAGGHRGRAPGRREHVPQGAVATLRGVPGQHVERVEAVAERRCIRLILANMPTLITPISPPMQRGVVNQRWVKFKGYVTVTC